MYNVKKAKIDLKTVMYNGIGEQAPEWLWSDMCEALANDSALISLYEDYWESSLQYYGIKPLEKK